MKPFDLEAFKKGQKALTRDGRVATFVGICEQCYANCKLIAYIDGNMETRSFNLDGLFYEDGVENKQDLASMVSRHQALIDNYDPDDTWQVHAKQSGAWVTIKEPDWSEDYDWRLHPRNDLIKAWKKGEKIEACITGDWVEEPMPNWCEDTQYRIKTEPVIHCLAYDAKRFNHESTTAVRARVVKKEAAVANGWTIIQEWEA